ncbi:hypothetical protein GRZ55_02850 [Chelativorans sp. ZYF759]|uniref:hypothetical protein n=1 Tax=Chelativorans sp. ZYF759 TaxID=2692213 RepID=UPI00145F35A9|nr:hypothetical protein [Chelativorans sp. ZYF759]NMG38178.1 hypothetical protein [Chelativorans sp. ZYF759]
MRLIRKSLVFAFAAVIMAASVGLGAGVVQAHHGWAWTEDDISELEGTIVSISLGNPHAALDVDVDGEIWHVELAPPRATASSGFVEGVADEGDTVQAIGHRSRTPEERTFKAVRLIIGGETYDIYPRRLPAD